MDFYFDDDLQTRGKAHEERTPVFSPRLAARQELTSYLTEPKCGAGPARRTFTYKDGGAALCVLARV